MSTMLSEHFSLEEATISNNAERAGIENKPDGDQLATMLKVAVKMEKVRAALNDRGIVVTSWFRNLKVNRLAGSKDSSQHLKGEAVDFVSPRFGSPVDVCKRLVEMKELIGFDQLILEHSWVHISFAIRSGKPRGQVLSLLSNGEYAVGLTNKNGVPY